MKIIKIKSGLGNQMFQYAFAKTWQALSNDKVLLDISHFKLENLHNGFELAELFNIDLPIAAEDEVKRIGTIPDSFVNRIRRKYLTKPTHYIENEELFDKNVFSFKDDHYFEGYWQNEKYFEPIKQNINSIFSFKKPLNAESCEAEKQITSKTASIHIRRGDYLLKMNSFLNVCDLAYYEKALQTLKGKTEIDRIIVFSDDSPWCRDNLNTGNIPVVYADWNTGRDSWQDMYLMSRCMYNIIPNSSFSWWAAYLNPNPGKIVIAPAIWKKTAGNTKKELPANWIKIEL